LSHVLGAKVVMGDLNELFTLTLNIIMTLFLLGPSQSTIRTTS
jgi:hypothetical protein